MLKGILGEHDVIIDSGLVDGDGEEQLAALWMEMSASQSEASNARFKAYLEQLQCFILQVFRVEGRQWRSWVFFRI
jgi:hypothetical protein